MIQYKKVAFYTLGCKLNFSETSTIARLFEGAGFAKVEFEEEPDIYVINTCSVTENADKKCKQLVKKALKINPDAFIAIIGCFAQLKPVEIGKIPGVDLVLGANEKFNILDHLEEIGEAEIQALQNSNTIPLALPSCSFYLGIPYAPVRKMMEANLPVAIATDYNPGSTPSGNMNFLLSLACIRMKMLPEEAINAATLNAAYAMDVAHEVGSISKGKRANLIITQNIPSYTYLTYSFGENCIEEVLVNGETWLTPPQT